MPTKRITTLAAALAALLSALALLTADGAHAADEVLGRADGRAAAADNKGLSAAAGAASRRNDRAPRDDHRKQGRTGEYELISTSSHSKGTPPPPPDQAGVPSSELPAADKQYEYPLVRPVYAPFVTRPSSSYGLPFVEFLDHHRNPSYAAPGRPPGAASSHFAGSPMVSTVVVQDMSQTPAQSSPPERDHVVSVVENFHHLGPTKIPFTDLQIVTKPLGGGSNNKHDVFTDKVEETSLGGSDEGDSAEQQLISDPDSLDVGGLVEDVVRRVFEENKAVLGDAQKLIPAPDVGVKTWDCPPVTCCSKASAKSPRLCSTFVSCVTGRSPECPLRAEQVPPASALSKPSNGHTNATDPNADIRDGEPRFKKKKILKKKKKFLKKFMMPLLLAYKLLFMLIVPLLVNGMMMMMSSSGMAGFFFALIGASVTMVRVYSGATRAPAAPPKVVKVVKYIESPSTAQPSPAPSPAPAPAPTPTVVHHQPHVEEHFPTYPHYPSYGSYYPHPYWPRSEGLLDGGRKRRRRIDVNALRASNLNELLLNSGWAQKHAAHR